MNEFNPIQSIKRRFFAMRNGVIADTLRRAGSPFKIIFGLNLPQLVEIASETGKNPEIAEALWMNRSTRESMLLAPMLLDPAAISKERALAMVSQVPSAEVADLLCHRLLRLTPYAFELAVRLASSPQSMDRYCSMRILWHFMSTRIDEVCGIAKAEIGRNDAITLRLAMQICDEIDFIRENA